MTDTTENLRSILKASIPNYIDNNAEVTVASFLQILSNELCDFVSMEEFKNILWSEYEIGCKAKKIKPLKGNLQMEIKKLIKGKSRSQEPSYATTEQQNTSSRKSRATSSSMIDIQVKLSDNDKTTFNKNYEEIDESDMWPLSSGTFVEKVVMKHGLKCSYEHLSHSLIIDPEDEDLWLSNEYFSAEELSEIQNTVNPAFRFIDSPLPRELHEFLYSFQNRNSYDELYEACGAKGFINPQKQPELHWIQDSFVQGSKLFLDDFIPLKKNATEEDIINRVWNFIREAFCGTGVQVICGGGSAASSESRNTKRKLPGEDKMDRQVPEQLSDMSFIILLVS